MKDFQGHDFRVSAAPNEPYVMAPNPSGVFENGIEVEIIQNIVKSIDMGLKWISLPANEHPRMLKNAKNEYAGLFGLLHRLEADLAFGGISGIVERSYVTELTTFHTQDIISWLLASAPEANNLGAIFSVFSIITWLLLFFSIILFTLVLSLKTYLKNFPENLFQSLGILLDQGINLQSQYYLNFWLLFILYCLIVTNAYRSGLITAITSETQEKWFESPEEAVNAGETTYMSLSGMPVYQSLAIEDPMWRTILKPGRHIGIQDNSILKNVSKTRHGLVSCVRYPCQFAIYRDNLIGRNLKPELIFLEKRFIIFWTTMFMAPGSVLKPTIDLRTFWLKEGGLIDNWMDKLMSKVKLTALYGDHGECLNCRPKKLSLLHLKSTFVIFGAFLLLSFCVFWLELFIMRKKQFPKKF